MMDLFGRAYVHSLFHFLSITPFCLHDLCGLVSLSNLFKDPRPHDFFGSAHVNDMDIFKYKMNIVFFMISVLGDWPHTWQQLIGIDYIWTPSPDSPNTSQNMTCLWPAAVVMLHRLLANLIRAQQQMPRSDSQFCLLWHHVNKQVENRTLGRPWQLIY